MKHNTIINNILDYIASRDSPHIDFKDFIMIVIANVI